MFTILSKKLAKILKTINTLSSNKPNHITNVDEQGLYIETESSREKYNKGEKSEPHELITYSFLTEAWNEFTEKRTASANDLTPTHGRTSFLMAFFAQFPFVEVDHTDSFVTIRLREFKTDELPCEPFHKTLQFLDEVIEGIYHPENLSSELQGQKYRVKSSARQDLRMLGFLDEFHQKNESLFTRYIQASDKHSVLQEVILHHDYFRITLFLLDLLKGESVSIKKNVLVELGMLIVRNSRGNNLMVESVATERTQYLLNWLKHVKLIDEDYHLLIDISESREQINMNTNLQTHFLHIMNTYLKARKESFAGHSIGALVRNEVPKEIRSLAFIDENYTVTGSVGQGNWAIVPWIAIMNKKVTTSTQRGYYLGYLFSEDMKRLYLTFAQGVTETSRQEMATINHEIRTEIQMGPKVKKDDHIHLGESKRARDYAYSTAAYIKYDMDNLPAEEELVHDLEEMTSYYESYISFKNTQYKKSNSGAETISEEQEAFSIKDIVHHIHSYITSKGFYYEKDEVMNLFLSLKTKPFVILSGISGTGKTKIVQWLAESVGATEENGQFALIPVRPDWSDGSDLLGYVDIKGDFKEGPLTKVLTKAIAQPERPYFVLLDEMNLARVEHYFSDLLSVMESRKWENGELITSMLLSEEIAGQAIYIPSNVYIIGTVNMDETTYPFSKKVLDRANTLEFNRVKLDHLLFLEEEQEKSAFVLHNDKFATEYLHLKDVYAVYPDLVKKVTDILVKMNEALAISSANIGYRVRDEICFYLAYNEQGKLLGFEEALDYCILQKILPRLAGSDSRIERVLRELFAIFTSKQIEAAEDAAVEDITFATYPKSAEKVLEMMRRLEDDGFTSFWLSS
ncbi:ATPase AAA [Bacillus sp. TS-2]|nr:ATPase AAA [Bacillus sp. TS-2]